MKKLHKISIVALSTLFLVGAVACDGDPQGGTPGGDGVNYTDPNTVFTKYDNKNYNEYLLGEETTIENQWEGYGIGDPFIMRYNGTYYLYCSSLDTEVGVRAYKSADLVNWTPITGEGLREGYVTEDPVSRCAYAPEVYYFNGTFYMYTSPYGNGHYVLTATSPEGPFVKATNNFGMSIDGSVLIDDDESMWFTYASSGGIRMAKMDDMLTVNTSATPQLNGTSIGGWTEGPYILKRDGIYYLTYTGNHVTSEGYRIAYATADNVATNAGGIDRNAWTRAWNNPVALETETALKGIGHSSTVMGPDMDSHYLAYHMLNSSGGPNRSLGVDRLLFNGKQMSVSPSLTDSVTPTLPEFYALAADEEKFDESDTFLLSSSETADDFTAEFNLKGASTAEYVVGYTDASNYVSVVVNLTEKTVVLNEVKGGQSSQKGAGTLVNAFDANALHTVRVSNRGGKVDVVFDNMTKIDDAELDISAGKIGYKSVGEAEIGYTAFSNVAMGMSDEREAKQAEGIVGSSNYLYENTYNQATKLGEDSGLSVIAEGSALDGAKALTLGGNGDYVSYLLNFHEEGRYGLELTYKAEDGGKKIGVKVADGTVYRCTLPEIETQDGETYAKAIVGEFDVDAGITTVRTENLGEAITFACLSFVPVSSVTPDFEQTLDEYVENGADYKTIWKIKDGGHYAKAGTRQLVYFGDNKLTDFTLEVEMKLEGATGTSTAGIVFHAQNYAASSHDGYTSIQGYYLSINNNQIVLERLNYADDSRFIGTYVQGNPFATSDVFVPLKIQVRGNTYTVWSGETKLIEATDTFAFTAGKIGLYTNGAAVVFRNLKIST